ncbi:MAG: DUF3592 domain-containing protein [Verrucomicrobiota bacterium]
MTNHESKRSPFGLLWMGSMGLFLALVGSFFAWWLWATWKKAGLMDSWAATEARILQSEVRTYQFNEFSRIEFFPFIQYEFLWEGTPQQSEQLRRIPIRSAHQDKAEKWVRRYPVGKRITAFINPADPSISVLKRDSKASLYAIWFPCLFVAGGLGILFASMRSLIRR